MKVKCKVCDNELSGFCKIKKTKVKPNKQRTCEAYVFNEGKVKAKEEIHTVRVSYRDQERAKKLYKEELKKLKAMEKAGPQQGTAQDLGLVKPRTNLEHPLTGDLSRFTTTVSEKE